VKLSKIIALILVAIPFGLFASDQTIGTFTPSNSSTTYFANATITGAGPWTPANNGIAPDFIAHNISILNNTATNHSAKTLTITGFDADGRAQTENLAAPNTSATVVSAKFYSQITQISISATIGADTFSAAYGNLFVSPTYKIAASEAYPGTYFFGKQSGTITWNVQVTPEVVASATDQESVSWVTPNASLTTQSASSTAAQNIAPGYKAFRIKVASYSNGATLKIL